MSRCCTGVDFVKFIADGEINNNNALFLPVRSYFRQLLHIIISRGLKIRGPVMTLCSWEDGMINYKSSCPLPQFLKIGQFVKQFYESFSPHQRSFQSTQQSANENSPFKMTTLLIINESEDHFSDADM